MRHFARVKDKAQVEFWENALDGKGKRSKKEWDKILLDRGFTSCVDFPASLFYK